MERKKQVMEYHEILKSTKQCFMIFVLYAQVRKLPHIYGNDKFWVQESGYMWGGSKDSRMEVGTEDL